MIAFIKKYEAIFFLLIVIIFCAPIVLPYRFITLDGPAHLYNSKIIFQLLFNSNESVSSFFTFNNFPNPNYFYHAIATVLFLFFDSILVEKIIAVLYVFLFCYGFRKIILNNNAPKHLSYIIFPLVYSFTFLIGFYNFSFALAFLFWFIAFVSKPNFTFSRLNILVLFLLYGALYFSHLMVFLIAVLIGAYYLVTHFTYKTKNLLFILVTALPFLALGVWFIFSHTNYEPAQYISFIEIKNWLIEGRDIICRDYNAELFYAKAINYLIILMLLINLYTLFKNKKNFILFSWQNLFFVAAIFSLLLFFIAPNNLFSGGYLTVRLLLFFHVFMLLFLVFSSANKLQFNGVLSFLILVFSIKMLFIIYSQSINLGNDFKEYSQINKYIKNQSVVLPIDYSNNWLNSNYGCYLGATKNCVVLDNYEASTVHFPLVWKNKKLIPNNCMPDYGTSYNPKLNIIDYENTSNVKIDYVVRWKYAEAIKSNENNRFTDSILRKHFVKIFESNQKKAELFKHKN